MVCRRYTDKYAIQAWIISLSSTVSCVIGFGEIAVGVWLILHNVMFIGIVGQKVIHLYYAYVAAGAFASITAVFGLVASFLRRRRMLLLYMFLLLVSFIHLCVVWTLFYIEQKKVLALLPNRLHADNSSQYYEFIDRYYNCQLQNASSVQQTFKHQLQLCADFILRQSWSQVYGILALCAFLICLQIITILMSAVLIKLLKSVDASVHPVLPENSTRHTTTMQDEGRSEGGSHTQREEKVTREGSTTQLAPVPPTAPPPFPSPSTSLPMPPPPPPPVDLAPFSPAPLPTSPFPSAYLAPPPLPPAPLPLAPLSPPPLSHALLSPSYTNSNLTAPHAFQLYDDPTHSYNSHYTDQQSWSPHDNYYSRPITKL